jgi:hypothetical protein
MIRISDSGITFVENSFDNFIQRIDRSNITVETRDELTNEIYQHNTETEKVKSFWRYAKLHPGIFVSVSELLIRLING